MKKTIYLLIMALTFPIWKLLILLTDVMFAAHKQLIEWVENDN